MSLTITSPDPSSEVRTSRVAHTGLVDIVSGSFGTGYDAAAREIAVSLETRGYTTRTRKHRRPDARPPGPHPEGWLTAPDPVLSAHLERDVEPGSNDTRVLARAAGRALDSADARPTDPTPWSRHIQ